MSIAKDKEWRARERIKLFVDVWNVVMWECRRLGFGWNNNNNNTGKVYDVCRFCEVELWYVKYGVERWRDSYYMEDTVIDNNVMKGGCCDGLGWRRDTSKWAGEGGGKNALSPLCCDGSKKLKVTCELCVRVCACGIWNWGLVIWITVVNRREIMGIDER